MEREMELLKLIMNTRECLIYIHRQASLLDGYTDIQRQTSWMIDKIDDVIADLNKTEDPFKNRRSESDSAHG